MAKNYNKPAKDRCTEVSGEDYGKLPKVEPGVDGDPQCDMVHDMWRLTRISPWTDNVECGFQ